MTKDELMNELAKILDVDVSELTPDVNIAERLDSMGQISVLAMLKKKTGVSITANELAAINTIQDILDMLKGKGTDLE